MKKDYVVVYYDGFKERLRIQKELTTEMVKKHGKHNFIMSVLDNCIMCEFKSQNIFF